MRITISYGLGNQITRDFSTGSSMGAVLTDLNVKKALGYDNVVTGTVGGVPRADDYVLADDTVIVVIQRSCQKAATVYEEGEYCFFFWQIDPNGTEPPHIHVGPKNRHAPAKFWLQPIKLVEEGQYNERHLRKILRIIKKESGSLLSSWNAARH